ncbi:hypothetical protein DESACE_05180 [Desulfurella acetivorans A63]|nr:hypothetical protein DESACE_05180 [Desulfurella acetivorans A63]
MAYQKNSNRTQKKNIGELFFIIHGAKLYNTCFIKSNYLTNKVYIIYMFM